VSFFACLASYRSPPLTSIVKHGSQVRNSACQDGQPDPNEIHAPHMRDPSAACG